MLQDTQPKQDTLDNELLRNTSFQTIYPEDLSETQKNQLDDFLRQAFPDYLAEDENATESVCDRARYYQSAILLAIHKETGELIGANFLHNELRQGALEYEGLNPTGCFVITNTSVKPGYQNKGIGSTLIEKTLVESMPLLIERIKQKAETAAEDTSEIRLEAIQTPVIYFDTESKSMRQAFINGCVELREEHPELLHNVEGVKTVTAEVDECWASLSKAKGEHNPVYGFNFYYAHRQKYILPPDITNLGFEARLDEYIVDVPTEIDAKTMEVLVEALKEFDQVIQQSIIRNEEENEPQDTEEKIVSIVSPEAEIEEGVEFIFFGDYFPLKPTSIGLIRDIEKIFKELKINVLPQPKKPQIRIAS